MLAWRDRLSTRGDVQAFDYPYMRAGRKTPDRLPALLEAHRTALAEARLRAGGEPPAFLGFFTSTGFTVGGNVGGLERVLREPERRFELMVHPAVAEMPAAAPPGVGLAAGQAREPEELRNLSAFFRLRAPPSGRSVD